MFDQQPSIPLLRAIRIAIIGVTVVVVSINILIIQGHAGRGRRKLISQGGFKTLSTKLSNHHQSQNAKETQREEHVFSLDLVVVLVFFLIMGTLMLQAVVKQRGSIEFVKLLAVLSLKLGRTDTAGVSM